MATGFSFVDNSQISIREKIDKYFQKKNNIIPVVVEESSSCDSICSADSFSLLVDNDFAEILNKNQHVTLIRNTKKTEATQTNSEHMRQENEDHNEQYSECHDECQMESKEEDDSMLLKDFRKNIERATYMPTPTRRGQVRRVVKSDDSIEPNPLDLWAVSDESFLEMEALCQSPIEKQRDFADDTTLLCDVEEPSFMNCMDLDDSVFERPQVSMLSPIKQVAIRRPSTIPEESTIRSIDSSSVQSGSSLSLKQSVYIDDENTNHGEVKQSTKSRSYRPSLVNVFPTRSRIGFFDHLESLSSSTEPLGAHTKGKENSFNLIRFENLDQESPQTAPRTGGARKDSVSLIHFDSSIKEASPSNLTADQSEHNLSSDTEVPDQFNDTLEAVEYYMKEGKKIMDKTSASNTLLQPFVSQSPKARNNSLLKQTLARRHLMNVNSDSKFVNKKLF